MRLRDILKKINYIYWNKEAKHVRCTQEEFIETFDLYKKNGKEVPYTTKRECYNKYSYTIFDKGYNRNLYCYDGQNYYIYFTNYIDDSKNRREESFGKEGMQELNKGFKEDNGITLLGAFGYAPEEWKVCVPKILCWYNHELCHKELTTSGVDFSSHWPFNAGGQLPDSHTAVEYKGTVAPTKEYPFALYINSGHVAEYGKYDTHEWVDSRMYTALFRFAEKREMWPHKPLLNKDEDITILMKPSKYELGEYFKKFYDNRMTDDNAKVKANATIGMMHRKDEYDKKPYRLVHLVAFILARANNMTLEACKKIGYFSLVHVIVDGIIYLGNEEIGQETKEFGKLHQEWTGCSFKMHKANSYIVFDNDKCIKVKHQGFETYNDGREITKENVKSLDDFKDWITAKKVPEK